MATRIQVDAQFDRAVQIVQGLPKTGPIQTGYEDKLMMYSLYKQATVGNVQGQRPGMWDMLGRAKWDAWAKHKDIDSYRAKVLYVDSLLKVLRKYSDKTVARDLVREIESYAPGFARSHSSGSSGSSAVSLRKSGISGLSPRLADEEYPMTEDETGSEEGDDDDQLSQGEADVEAADAARPLVPLPRAPTAPTQRSHSSLSGVSGSRYRTPGGHSLGGLSLYHTPISFPPTQPHSGHIAPSAFSGSPPARPLPLPLGPDPSHAGPSSWTPGPLPLAPAFRASPVENAVQALQGTVAALQERIDVLEHMLLARAGPGHSPSLSPSWLGGSTDADSRAARSLAFDPADLGLWSLIVRPIAGLYRLLVYAVRLVLSPRLAGREPPSPVFMIIRRLALDASFAILVLFFAKKSIRASRTRRRDVQMALAMLLHAVTGKKVARSIARRV